MLGPVITQHGESFVDQVAIPVVECGRRTCGEPVAFCPAEKIPQRHESLVAGECGTAAPPQLQLLHDGDEPLAERPRHVAPFVQDHLQLVSGDLVKVQLDESVAEGSREQLVASVLTILSGEDQEARMRLDRFLRLRNEQLSIVVQHSIESFENFAGRQVQLVQDESVSLAHSIHQHSFSEHPVCRWPDRPCSSFRQYAWPPGSRRPGENIDPTVSGSLGRTLRTRSDRQCRKVVAATTRARQSVRRL